MKSIIYILLVVFLSGIVFSALPKSILHQKQVVRIQYVDKSPDTNLLDVSCSIIKNRLKDCGLQSFDVYADTTQKTINITFRDRVDVNEILPLIISKGEIGFYETYDRYDVLKRWDKDDKLFSLLSIPPVNNAVPAAQITHEAGNSSAIFGRCSAQSKSLVDSCIAKHYVSKQDQDIKYAWSERLNKNSNYILYVLKTEAAMDKSQVSEADVVKQPKAPDNFDLMVNFTKNGTLAWQSLSKSNIGKQIAIVLDNAVYCAPTVIEEINNGKCVISGSFSAKEITRLKSLVNNDVLPLEFKLKE